MRLPPIGSGDGEALPGKLVWFDLLTDDDAAARRFYGELFGWTFDRSQGPTGYSLIQAKLREQDSVGRPALAHAAVWAANPRNGDLAMELSLLADAHAVVRQDEHEDRTARRRVIADNAARYEQQRLRRHPRLTLGEGGAKHLSELLEPSLVAALARARDSPQELWEVLRGADHVFDTVTVHICRDH